MSRRAILFILLPVVGCAGRFVSPPVPENTGAFLVHRVRSTDESFPKILTWYTGTTLSQQIVLRHNAYVVERELRVGDTIRIPLEVVANERPYGDEVRGAAPPAVDLLMEAPSAKKSEEPRKESLHLETFDDESNPDNREVSVTPAADVAPSGQDSSVRITELEREIREREAELKTLKERPTPTSAPVIDAAPTPSQEVLD